MKDGLDPARADALAATLGLGWRFAPGDALPAFFHQLYFWELTAPDDLGEDGHTRLGLGTVPDLGLPRRMWGGGRLVFHRSLRAGVAAEKVSLLESVEAKEGRTGELGLATVRHELFQDGARTLTEWQELVYRPAAQPGERGPLIRRAPEDENLELRRPDAVTLFRYSALTFNAHRIHYDLPFTTGPEGYPGLLVQGPLLAQYLMLKAEAELGALKGFSFRALAPVFLGTEIGLCRAGPTLWVRDADGRLCMEATAEPA